MSKPGSATSSNFWRFLDQTFGHGLGSRALRLIEEGALDNQDINSFAERLGIGERHLRRLFSEYVGASPMTVARAQRVLRAKRLITDSDMSMTEIAHQTGFSSIRQFNHTFRKLYAKPPTELRQSTKRNENAISK